VFLREILCGSPCNAFLPLSFLTRSITELTRRATELLASALLKMDLGIEYDSHFAVISDITIREIQPAPDFIKELLEEIINIGAELIYETTESEELAELYLMEGALNSKSLEDANHIALATIENVSALVSWNFKHIVNLNRIRLFNIQKKKEHVA